MSLFVCPPILMLHSNFLVLTPEPRPKYNILYELIVVFYMFLKYSILSNFYFLLLGYIWIFYYSFCPRLILSLFFFMFKLMYWNFATSSDLILNKQQSLSMTLVRKISDPAKQKSLTWVANYIIQFVSKIPSKYGLIMFLKLLLRISIIPPWVSGIKILMHQLNYIHIWRASKYILEAHWLL